ncbi:CBS domain-containing protein [Tropicimonas isoalkanivorans]|uniref:CBS domain-containing protein n=1 Tax=Tropicimonas isoalkanivorans TaxID=441112 RepID=A0A1I1NPT3_9RHOB|nr:CBS domain-containing protein [Tropicimonas isoalkanivorans]SFC96773.1 CBS domain-containing protein [Tropicimonas isoalkanivorans]
MIIRTISDVVHGRPFVSVGPWETVRTACDRLNAADVGAVCVLDGDRLVGILSENDVIRRAIAQGRPTSETAVDQIMTPDPVTVDQSVSLSDAMQIMLRGAFRHLPVMAAGRPVNMLSMRDIPTEYRLMVECYQSYVVETPRVTQPLTI